MSNQSGYKDHYRAEQPTDEGLDETFCSASDLLERWEERIRDTPERAKSGGVDYVGGLIDAYGTCLHEIREFLEQNKSTNAEGNGKTL